MKRIEDINFDNLNRQQKRKIIYATKRNYIKQVVPLFAKPSNERTAYASPIGFKTIWHRKRNNMPRLYPGMSKAKVTVQKTVE